MAPVQLTEERLQALLTAAAEAGARRALEQIGLHDDDAPDDVRDLRGLLDNWRIVSRSAMAAMGQAIGLAVLAGLVGWAAAQKWGGA
jgi:hypothetical protein